METKNSQNTNKLIIFAGPSGVGKTTIEQGLFDHQDLKLKFSCSATTRKPRDGEKEGIHYYFLSKEEFDNKIANDEFLEWNEHFLNKYGTLKSEIRKIISQGYTPFLEVDVDGAKNILQKKDEFNIISFFIMPPSFEELEKRIKERNTEKEDQIKLRLERAKKEMTYKDLFDYIIVNDDVNKTIEQIVKIIKG